MGHRTGPIAEGFEQRVRGIEQEWLAPWAVRSYETSGRMRAEDDECPLRTPFQRDRDRIVHSQGLPPAQAQDPGLHRPEGDHFRTRLTHTLEVAGISRNVARPLALNEDLTEAVALGHDLGHTPFGHTGEEALDRVLQERCGRRFRHNEHSLRIVDVIEHDGLGLNLTNEVRDGILNHTGPGAGLPVEGAIVRLVDRFAYVNHDIDDAVRAGVLDPGDLPAAPVDLLGATASERIDALVHDLVETSAVQAAIRQTAEYADALAELRAFMFENVYLSPQARTQTAQRRRSCPSSSCTSWSIRKSSPSTLRATM